MNKTDIVSEILREDIEDSQIAFKAQVKRVIRGISEIDLQIATLQSRRKELTEEFASMEYIEPKLPDLS